LEEAAIEAPRSLILLSPIITESDSFYYSNFIFNVTNTSSDFHTPIFLYASLYTEAVADLNFRCLRFRFRFDRLKFFPMVDHYQVLGVTRNATKKEVKDAFRRLAIKYHPDKHAQSPEHVRHNATVRFKLVSEAYEVLNDDLKRASYNAGSDSDCFRRTSGSYSNPYGNRGGRAQGSGYGYGYGYSTRNRQASSFSSGFDSTFRYLTTRAFLLNLALAGGLYFAFTAIDTSGETLWKMRNSGKSFEEAMESIEKSKSHKDEG